MKFVTASRHDQRPKQQSTGHKETTMARKTHVGTATTIDLRARRRRTHSGWQAQHHQRLADGRIPQLAIVRPVAKTSLTPGTVVWAHVPYEECDGYKLRP